MPKSSRTSDVRDEHCGVRDESETTEEVDEPREVQPKLGVLPHVCGHQVAQHGGGERRVHQKVQSGKQHESDGRRELLNVKCANGHLSSALLLRCRQPLPVPCREHNSEREVQRQDEREKRRNERTEQRLEHDVVSDQRVLEIVGTEGDVHSRNIHVVEPVEEETERHDDQHIDAVHCAEHSD